jgi:hypothetical protein
VKFYCFACLIASSSPQKQASVSPGKKTTNDDNAEAKMRFYSPALSAKDFKQRIGDLTQTIFFPESTQVKKIKF